MRRMDDARRLLDHSVISERYFFPRREPLAEPFIVSAGGCELHCFRRSPHPGAPTLLHFHGNGEVVADWLGDFAPALLAAGLNVVFAEYRGYGGSTGTPVLGSMLDDAVAIADAINVAPDQLFVYGRSVGSIYALHVAAERQVAGLIIESGIAHVMQRLAIRLEPAELGASQAQLDAAVSALLDHRRKIQTYGGPALILHTLGDHLVPPDHARDLAAWAGARADLVLFDRGDHNSIHYYNGDQIVSRVQRFTGCTG